MLIIYNIKIESFIYILCIQCIMKFITKSITIKSEQEDWIKKNHISLSRFVQQALQDVMDDWEGMRNENIKKENTTSGS